MCLLQRQGEPVYFCIPDQLHDLFLAYTKYFCNVSVLIVWVLFIVSCLFKKNNFFERFLSLSAEGTHAESCVFVLFFFPTIPFFITNGLQFEPLIQDQSCVFGYLISALLYIWTKTNCRWYIKVSSNSPVATTKTHQLPFPCWFHPGKIQHLFQQVQRWSS